MIHVDPVGSQKSILRSNPIFPPQSLPHPAAWPPLFCPSWQPWFLAWIPAALADALEGDSSGKQPHSGATVCLYLPCSGRPLVQPKATSVSLEGPGRNWEHCQGGPVQRHLKIRDDLWALDRVMEFGE